MRNVQDVNGITVMLALIVGLSTIHGWLRGGAHTGTKLLTIITKVGNTVISVVLAIVSTVFLSPAITRLLVTYVQAFSSQNAARWEQMCYACATVVLDVPFVYFLIIFVSSYFLIQCFITTCTRAFITKKFQKKNLLRLSFSMKSSRLIGALFGTVIGITRLIVVVASLFFIVRLHPSSLWSSYIEASFLYKQSIRVIVTPFSEKMTQEHLPVFSKILKKELQTVLQRKYEVIDYHIPSHISEMASSIVRGYTKDEDKAKALYKWMGASIHYDDAKVIAYEQKGVWHEQTPEHTFSTRKGVCIDYARLYAIMGRSQGLKVKVVTGLGYNGRGGFGPHAWNEVYIKHRQGWVPLDATWASTGNWFNSPHFKNTHIKDLTM